MIDHALRYGGAVTLTIAEGAALSDVLDFRFYAQGVVHMPDAWTAASIGFKVSPTPTGTFLPLYDAAGTLVEVTPAVDKAYLLPAGVAGAGYVKLWSQTEGSDVVQVAAASLALFVKS